MEFIRLVLNICIDSIVISTTLLQRSPSLEGIALILSVLQVTSFFLYLLYTEAGRYLEAAASGKLAP